VSTIDPTRHRATRSAAAALVPGTLALAAACALRPPATPAAPSTRVAAPQGAAGQPQDFSGTGYYQSGGGEWGERVVVDVQFVPSAWFDFDGESPQQPGFEVGSADGHGYGLRAAFGNRDQSVGVLYQGFDLDGDQASVELHSVYLDFDVRVYLQELDGKLFVQAGAGVGFASLDYDRQFADADEASAQLRVSLGIEPTRTFSAALGFGGAVFGHLGDTEGYGTFLLLDAAVSF
jgi:hypothetical protein